jgi:transcriptional regulator with XRE-family HTH domain
MDRAPTKIEEDHTAGWWLAHRRGQLRWKARHMAVRFREVGRWYLGAPKYVSLVSMISRWEHDEVVPESYNLHILAEVLGVEVGELGFPLDPHYVHPARRTTPLPLD